MGSPPVNSVPVVRDVCLVGGGHSHVLLIRRWAMRPLPGVRLTLVSSAVMTPYSGMLPGLIAGHYEFEDIHIDLRRLCTWAGVRFIEETVTSLDLQERAVGFENRPSLAFDVLSLDTGSTPDLSVEGATRNVTPVKPVHNFHARWRSLVERLQDPGADRVSIGVVGSGAGGFELVAAMRHHLPQEKASLHWFLRDDKPLSGRPARVGELALAAAQRQGIAISHGFDVIRIESGKLVAADGREVELDEILWCTAAAGPDWPAKAGLDVDERGFVATNAFLQSLSHDFVFASGDIGTQLQTPSAKAGVYAVRQAPFLFENIRRFILGESLRAYRPQKDFLSLMATGGKRAIANRGLMTLEGDWVWHWKDHIDRTFMKKFKALPPMRTNANLLRLSDTMREQYSASMSTTIRCRGCGSKVGETILERVLSAVRPVSEDAVSSQYSPAGDVSVLDLNGGTLVQSVDHINAIVDDPYLLGRIAALHALSDVVTVDATAHSAQVVVTVPAGSSAVVERDLTQLMTGLVEALGDEHCALVGGHTMAGDELSVGVVINGVLNESVQDEGGKDDSGTDESGTDESVTDESVKDKCGNDEGGGKEDVGMHSRVRQPAAKAGDVLILTQPLGIAILFAGLMQQLGNGDDISAALRHMLKSNRDAAHRLRQAGASVMTDITGFGLLGHLDRLLRGLGKGACVQTSGIPLLSGALQLAEQGVRSSLWPENSQVLDALDIDPGLTEPLLSVLCDPQTGGGLLAVVPAAARQACLASLQSADYSQAAVIGIIVDAPGLTVS